MKSTSPCLKNWMKLRGPKGICHCFLMDKRNKINSLLP
uniref:Uncharacterized protein n=1 Tax=Rhizophora mucronata TaxID=61149 RepID=A0A2P2PLJ2_RHIMU